MVNKSISQAFKERLQLRSSDWLFYGITPPKRNNSPEKLYEIASLQNERISNLSPDALVVYDIQDESCRTAIERPFPFLETLAPEDYFKTYLSGIRTPGIVYHSVAQQTEDTFRQWLRENQPDALVLVGAPSGSSRGLMTLQRAYEIRQEFADEIPLGGIVIPERHSRKGDEHLRVWSKIDAGCSFFISQCVYSVESTKNFLSDYHWFARRQERETVPIIFTLTPCGSEQTLNFMKWLGIAIPDWIRNELLYAADMLECSLKICTSIAEELSFFCQERNIPFGFNIESVSIRKQEIDASVVLAREVGQLLQERNAEVL